MIELAGAASILEGVLGREPSILEMCLVGAAVGAVVGLLIELWTKRKGRK